MPWCVVLPLGRGFIFLGPWGFGASTYHFFLACVVWPGFILGRFFFLVVWARCICGLQIKIIDWVMITCLCVHAFLDVFVPVGEGCGHWNCVFMSRFSSTLGIFELP